MHEWTTDQWNIMVNSEEDPNMYENFLYNEGAHTHLVEWKCFLKEFSLGVKKEKIFYNGTKLKHG